MRRQICSIINNATTCASCTYGYSPDRHKSCGRFCRQSVGILFQESLVAIPLDQVATSLDTTSWRKCLLFHDSNATALCANMTETNTAGDKNKTWSGPVSRVLCRRLRAGDGHSSRTPVARRLERPTRKSGNGPDRFVTRVRKRTSRLLPVWPCTRWGLPSQVGHPTCWCALTAPFHPYRTRRKRRARRSILCGTFPSLAAGGRYPPPCPAVPGLSSRRIEIRPATIQPAPGHHPFYHIWLVLPHLACDEDRRPCHVSRCSNSRSIAVFTAGLSRHQDGPMK